MGTPIPNTAALYPIESPLDFTLLMTRLTVIVAKYSKRLSGSPRET